MSVFWQVHNKNFCSAGLNLNSISNIPSAPKATLKYVDIRISWSCKESYFWERSQNCLSASRSHPGLLHQQYLSIDCGAFMNFVFNQHSFEPTCAFMLQTLAVISFLADAVVLTGVCATLAAGHQVAAVFARFTKRRASWQFLLDVAACGLREICRKKEKHFKT